MVSLEQFRPIVLDYEGPGHGFDIYHSLKVSSSIRASGTVATSAR